MRKLEILLFILCFALSSRAMADSTSSSSSKSKSANSYVYFGVNFAPVITETNDSIRTFGGSFPGEGAANTSTVFGYDARFTLGPIFWNHVLLGFSYNILSEVTHRPSSPGGDTTRNEDLEQREFGPTLGFLFGHWQLKGTWIISSTKVDTDSEANDNGTPAVNTETKNYGGHGWEIELGYAFEILENLFIGPNLVYRYVQYGMQSYTDNITPGNSYYGKGFTDKADDGAIDPMILIVLKF